MRLKPSASRGTTTTTTATGASPFYADDARATLASLAVAVRDAIEGERSVGANGGTEAAATAAAPEATGRTMDARADDGSSARVTYAWTEGNGVGGGGGRRLRLRVDAVDARGSDADGLLLHWGARARRGGEWVAPQSALKRVPNGSRAPDGRSCESKFEDDGMGGQVIEIDVEARREDVCEIVFLIRTRDCKVWFKVNGEDITIPVEGAFAARFVERVPEDEGRAERREREEVKAQDPPPPPPPSAKPVEDVQFAALNQWRGQEVKLQTHKGGYGDRNLRWNTDNLADAARRIVEGDRDSSSWRQKLQMVEKVLCDNGADVDSLAYVTVYLFWISVGAIMCVEDGTHYRPNHHAGSAERMYGAIEAAERCAHEIANGGDHHRARELRALIRRLHPRLPAFTAEFTQSVPLTRIRDIAHGKGDTNGKCRDVRQEIKHTIQNKLHRCAGPEDLVATEAMLAKLTAPGTDYPEEFVNEFKIFYRELKEFFNASSVADRIDRIANENGAPGRASEASKAFLTAKLNVDALPQSNGIGDQAMMRTLVECLRALHGARTEICAALEQGGDLEHAQASMRQQWRLAEVSMEDYAFVLLSRLLNTLGAEAEPPRNDISAGEVKLALEALALTSRIMALSAGGDHELEATASEAEALAHQGLPEGEEGGLRVQAIAERARRAAVDFCSLLESLFDGRASSLGDALGIDRDSVSVFTEGQIRASVVFQSAKFASLLLRVSRRITGAAGWDCVVQGEAIGTLKSVMRLTPEECASFKEPVILLVANADGDEEVSTCGPYVRGVVLCHALPHLSHLALRARQAQVPLIAVEDENLVDHARSLLDKSTVKLSANASTIKLEETNETVTVDTAVSQQSEKPTLHLDADLSRASTVLSLVDLDERGLKDSIRIAGTKSAMCARLSSIAARSSHAFAAPTGVVIPFGAMEYAAASVGDLERLDVMIHSLNAMTQDPEQIRETCEAIQSLIRGLRPSSSTFQVTAQKFGPNARVMVRSSANVEDLEGMSAAGLYDSIPNVNLHDEDAFGRAVADVWASLYTTRAVASRAAAGIDHLEANMCVLVQEMLSPEVSFVLHTKHPLTNDPKSAYLEFALGLGETLASGAVRGTPCRVSVDRESRRATVNAFASFGTALVRDDDSPSGMKSVAANYTTHWLQTDAKKREDIVGKLVDIGSMLERELSPSSDELLAQDIEGCILPDGQIYIVQARPQP